MSLACYVATSAQTIEPNPVVISATRTEQALSQVLSSVSVITRQEIDQTQAVSLADLLRGEAGFEFGRNGGPGTTTSFFLRGQNSANLVLMIDGVRTQTDILGSLAQTDLPLSQIERIEILRGNASALYGDAALGGVINIYTRKGKGALKPYGSISYGTFNTRAMSVGYGGETDGKSFDLNAGTSKSDGFSSMNHLQNKQTNPADNGHSKQHFSLNFENKLSNDLRLGTRISTSRSDTSYDKNDFNSYIFKTRNDTMGIYGRQQVNDAWFSTLDLSSSVLKYEDLKNGSPYPISSFTSSYLDGKQNALRWSNVYEIAKKHKATFGADVIKDIYESSGIYGSKMNRNTQGYYGGLTSVFSDLTFQANLRRDHVTLDNTKNVSNVFSNSKIDVNSTLIGVGYQLNPVWRLTATTSSGFRAPTAYDISTNTAVKQEDFKSKEVGLVYSDKTTYGRLVYFKTRTQNAIAYIDGPAPDYLTSAVNIGDAKNSGVEASFRANWFDNHIKISVVQQDPWNISENEQLSRRARRYGSIDVSRHFGDYELGSNFYVSGRRKDSPYNTHMLAGYSLWAFHASYMVNNEWTARIKLENAFDKQYQLAYGYNTPGRGIYATLQYSPKR